MKFRKALAGVVLALMIIVNGNVYSGLAQGSKVVFSSTGELSNMKISINGQSAQYMQTYNVDGYNFVSLRQVTDALDNFIQFAMVGEGFSMPYFMVSSEIKAENPGNVNKLTVNNVKADMIYGGIDYRKTKDPATISSNYDSVLCFNYADHFYVKLADVQTASNGAISVKWDEGSRTVLVNQTKTGTGNVVVGGNTGSINGGQVTNVLPTVVPTQTPVPVNSLNTYSANANYDVVSSKYIYTDSSGNLGVLTNANGKSTINTYNKDNQLLSTKDIQNELTRFGAFYSGANYNYIVFCEDNKENNSNKEVVRIVKYDKNFTKLGSTSINAGESDIQSPIVFSSCRMAEHGNELYVAFGRVMLKPDSAGVHHQALESVFINTDNMTVKNSLAWPQENYASHSFSQYVAYNGATPLSISLSDAYPRSIVMYNFNEKLAKKSRIIDILKIPGATGENMTGAMPGGFVLDGNSYVVSYSYATNNANKNSIRNIFLSAVPKNNYSQSTLKTAQITNYTGTTSGTAPKLVPLNNGYSVMMWNEYDIKTGKINDLSYIYVDKDGNKVGNINSSDSILKLNFQPIYYNGKIITDFNDTNSASPVISSIDIASEYASGAKNVADPTVEVATIGENANNNNTGNTTFTGGTTGGNGGNLTTSNTGGNYSYDPNALPTTTGEDVADNGTSQSVEYTYDNTNTYVKLGKIKLPNNPLQTTANIEVYSYAGTPDSRRPITGTSFELRDNSNGKTLSFKVTDSNGHISFSNLPYGSYQVFKYEIKNGKLVPTLLSVVNMPETDKSYELDFYN